MVSFPLIFDILLVSLELSLSRAPLRRERENQALGVSKPVLLCLLRQFGLLR